MEKSLFGKFRISLQDTRNLNSLEDTIIKSLRKLSAATIENVLNDLINDDVIEIKDQSNHLSVYRSAKSNKLEVGFNLHLKLTETALIKDNNRLREELSDLKDQLRSLGIDKD